MRTIIKLLILLVLTACNSDGGGGQTYHTTTQPVPTDTRQEDADKFQGVYYLPNGGRIDIVATSTGRVNIIDISQIIISENPNHVELATHPRIPNGFNLLPLSGEIRHIVDVNYSSNNKVREDVNSDVISGRKRTVFTLKMNSDECLDLKIEIFSDRIGYGGELIATRNLDGC